MQVSALSSSLVDLYRSVAYESGDEDAGQDVGLSGGTQVRTVCERDDETHRLPQAVVRERGLGVMREQVAYQS